MESPPSLHEHQKIINRFADILGSSHFQDVKDRKLVENGAPPFHGGIDVGTVVEKARIVAASMIKALQGEIPPVASPNTTSLIFKGLAGAAVIIPSRNPALILSVRGICSVLAAGRTDVVKAFEMYPWTHQIILETFEEAGLPAGCLSQVQASREQAAEVTEVLISHPGIHKIEFIGSPTLVES